MQLLTVSLILLLAALSCASLVFPDHDNNPLSILFQNKKLTAKDSFDGCCLPPTFQLSALSRSTLYGYDSTDPVTHFEYQNSSFYVSLYYDETKKRARQDTVETITKGDVETVVEVSQLNVVDAARPIRYTYTFNKTFCSCITVPTDVPMPRPCLNGEQMQRTTIAGDIPANLITTWFQRNSTGILTNYRVEILARELPSSKTDDVFTCFPLEQESESTSAHPVKPGSSQYAYFLGSYTDTGFYDTTMGRVKDESVFNVPGWCPPQFSCK